MFWLSLLACTGDPPPSNDTEPTETGQVAEPIHPAGYGEGSVHGAEAKLQVQICRACHGDDFDGGIAQVDCETCHAEAGVVDWSTNCTFCHGTGTSAAPPQDIDDNDDVDTISFPEHANHTVETELHEAFECVECHTTPDDVLSEGHVFVGDDTPGRAEVFWANGAAPEGVRSADARYDAATKTCSNVYCHGTVVANDEVTSGDRVGCGGCHAVSQDRRLSAPHTDHIDGNVDCHVCHPTAVREPDWEIVDKPSHIDGTITMIAAPGGLTWDAKTRACTGSCHGDKDHSTEAWSVITSP